MDCSTFIVEPTLRFPSCHAANLAVLGDERLAMVCFRGSREGGADTANTLTLGDGAGGWGAERVIVDEPGHPSGHAVLMPLPAGRLPLLTCARPDAGRAGARGG